MSRLANEAMGKMARKSEGRQNGFVFEEECPCRQHNCLTAAISLRYLCQFDASKVFLKRPDPIHIGIAIFTLWTATSAQATFPRGNRQMVDNFSLLLSHVLIVLTFWLLTRRDDLDNEPPPPTRVTSFWRAFDESFYHQKWFVNIFHRTGILAY